MMTLGVIMSVQDEVGGNALRRRRVRLGDSQLRQELAETDRLKRAHVDDVNLTE